MFNQTSSILDNKQETYCAVETKSWMNHDFLRAASDVKVPSTNRQNTRCCQGLFNSLTLSIVCVGCSHLNSNTVRLPAVICLCSSFTNTKNTNSQVNQQQRLHVQPHTLNGALGQLFTVLILTVLLINVMVINR